MWSPLLGASRILTIKICDVRKINALILLINKLFTLYPSNIIDMLVMSIGNE